MWSGGCKGDIVTSMSCTINWLASKVCRRNCFHRKKWVTDWLSPSDAVNNCFYISDDRQQEPIIHWPTSKGPRGVLATPLGVPPHRHAPTLCRIPRVEQIRHKLFTARSRQVFLWVWKRTDVRKPRVQFYMSRCEFFRSGEYWKAFTDSCLLSSNFSCTR